MREERLEIEGIPARLYDPGGARGLLLLGHGGGHSKDGPRFVNLARRYAEQTGLAVVCIDAVDHGERKPAVAIPGIPPRWHSENVDRMVADWRTATEALAHIGPAVAYVGFSMGAIFGTPLVAHVASIKAAVFVVGGIPTGGGIEDPALRDVLLRAAGALVDPQVLMLNMTNDEVFTVNGAHALFDAIPGDKRLMFWEGAHDDWPDELIAQSVIFLKTHAP